MIIIIITQLLKQREVTFDHLVSWLVKQTQMFWNLTEQEATTANVRGLFA